MQMFMPRRQIVRASAAVIFGPGALVLATFCVIRIGNEHHHHHLSYPATIAGLWGGLVMFALGAFVTAAIIEAIRNRTRS